eukprot:gene9046-6499_t
MTTLLQKRRKELRTELIQIEKQIYDLETAYLDETKDTGNIFTGWNMSANAEKSKSKKSTQNEDRHFSLSSITSPASRREESKKSGGQAGKKTKEVKVEDKEDDDEEADAN